MPSFTIHNGDVITILKRIESESIHCAITSPPYWGLRSYSVPPSVWGGDPKHLHRFAPESLLEDTRVKDGWTPGESCSCGAWRGCLGLEPTPEAFVDHLVEVFSEVRRVLRPEGICWVNLGDCYISNPHGDGHTFDPKYGGRNRSEGYTANRLGAKESGLKSKDLVMIPARVAIALQQDGWYLRSQIPWLKRNGMPDSVVDRPASTIEYIFMLAKNDEYFYDREAVRLPQSDNERTRRLREQHVGLDTTYDLRRKDVGNPIGATGALRSVKARQELAATGTRVRRSSDWFFDSWQGMMLDEAGGPLAMVVNPSPFNLEMCESCLTVFERAEFRKFTKDSETDKRICPCGAQTWLSHFATFPQRLVTPLILSATSEHGCCHHCGAPYVREMQKGFYGDWHPNGARGGDRMEPNSSARMTTTLAKKNQKENAIEKGPGRWSENKLYTPPRTTGWVPSCSHPLFPPEAIPCTVLDPFAGAGTTGLAAAKHGRSFVGIELNSNYILLATKRAEKAGITMEVF